QSGDTGATAVADQTGQDSPRHKQTPENTNGTAVAGTAPIWSPQQTVARTWKTSATEKKRHFSGARSTRGNKEPDALRGQRAAPMASSGQRRSNAAPARIAERAGASPNQPVGLRHRPGHHAPPRHDAQ